MRLQNSLLFTIFLTVCASAFTTDQSYHDDPTLIEPPTEHNSNLPESGQLVFTPQDNTPLDAVVGSDWDIFDMELDTATEAMVADWKTEVVRQHNAYRAHYGASALSWSDALYPGTQQWANQCKFQHSNGNGAYGENLVGGTFF